jgi:hypothetical protein
LPHTSHLNDFTPLWIRTWRFRLQLYENTLEHILHVYVLSDGLSLPSGLINNVSDEPVCRRVVLFPLQEDLLLHMPDTPYSGPPGAVCWSVCSVLLPPYWRAVKTRRLRQNKDCRIWRSRSNDCEDSTLPTTYR